MRLEEIASTTTITTTRGPGSLLRLYQERAACGLLSSRSISSSRALRQSLRYYLPSFFGSVYEAISSLGCDVLCVIDSGDDSYWWVVGGEGTAYMYIS